MKDLVAHKMYLSVSTGYGSRLPTESGGSDQAGKNAN
jgi:hypothetical protein